MSLETLWRWRTGEKPEYDTVDFEPVPVEIELEDDSFCTLYATGMQTPINTVSVKDSPGCQSQVQYQRKDSLSAFLHPYEDLQ